MALDSRELITRWYAEVWNNYDKATLNELLAKDAVCHDFPAPGQSCGFDGFQAALDHFHATFSDIHAEPRDILIDGDTAAARFHATMRHTGTGLGFAPTGLPVEFSGIVMIRTRNGQIVEGWNGLDLTAPFAQLREAAAKIEV